MCVHPRSVRSVNPFTAYNSTYHGGHRFKHEPLARLDRCRSDSTAIRVFPKLNVPEAELLELRRRINATQWPERETVTDASQGVQLATTQALARYWATDYDWRKIEARMNTLPQLPGRHA